jgi:glycosyltransferase involved in cell wall biosynthesis
MSDASVAPANRRTSAQQELAPLIVFADDWGRHPSSCQHLVRRMLDGRKVLWVNTIGTRAVKANSFTARRVVEKLKSWRQGLKQISESFWVYDVPMLPVSGSRTLQAINRRWVRNRLRTTAQRIGLGSPVVLSTLPYVHWMIEGLDRRGLIYYCTDDYSHWPDADRDALVKADRIMTDAADAVLAVSQALVDSHANARRCEYFPHGVDVEHFARAQDANEIVPSELASLATPRIGFFGLIYEKLDFQLLSTVAKRYPNASLAMIGPVDYCDESFRSLPNVHFLGRQPYSQLPGWIAGLDVLMMPYVRDEMIEQSCPLKLRECLASGKPTVSVDVPEVRKLMPHVFVARNADEFADEVGRALAEPKDSVAVRSRQDAVCDNDWGSRARFLEDVIASLSASKSEALPPRMREHASL